MENWIVGIVTGLISGVLSGYIVYIYTKRIDQKQRLIKEIEIYKQEYFNYLRTTALVIDQALIDEKSIRTNSILVFQNPMMPEGGRESISPKKLEVIKRMGKLVIEIDGELRNGTLLKSKLKLYKDRMMWLSVDWALSD